MHSRGVYCHSMSGQRGGRDGGAEVRQRVRQRKGGGAWVVEGRGGDMTET